MFIVFQGKGLLWKTFKELRGVFGEEDYDFMPAQYLLPDEQLLFDSEFLKNKATALQREQQGSHDPLQDMRWVIKQQTHRGIYLATGKNLSM